MRETPVGGLDMTTTPRRPWYTILYVQVLVAIGVGILIGIDKSMSECRALTNLVGNGVATIVISRWEGELDPDKLHAAMAHPIALGEELEREPA